MTISYLIEAENLDNGEIIMSDYSKRLTREILTKQMMISKKFRNDGSRGKRKDPVSRYGMQMIGVRASPK